MNPPVIGGQTATLETLRIGDHECRLYRVPSLDRLVDEIDPVEFERDERMPYWAELWPSGIALGTMLAARRSLRGVRLLELGCGLGLPSIVAARMGANVTATDYFLEALDLLAANAALNGVKLTTGLLDWRAAAAVGQFDLVVAADVLYEPWQVERIVEMLRGTVAANGRAIVVDPDRATARQFASAATFRGFRVTESPLADTSGRTRMIRYDLTWR